MKIGANYCLGCFVEMREKEITRQSERERGGGVKLVCVFCASKNLFHSEQCWCIMENIEYSHYLQAPARAAAILYGLGFTPEEQKKPTK